MRKSSELTAFSDNCSTFLFNLVFSEVSCLFSRLKSLQSLHPDDPDDVARTDDSDRTDDLDRTDDSDRITDDLVRPDDANGLDDPDAAR